MKYFYLILLSFILLLFGCKRENDLNRIIIWHQMRVDERVILHQQLQEFMQLHPGVQVEEIYKETEELRSGFIIAAIAGQGPDLVYGPADQVGPFQVMDIILPMDTLFDKEWLQSFNPKGLTWYKGHLYQIADKLGNHLTLVYNKKFITKPPETDAEFISIAQNFTKDLNGDGRIDQYGIVWNYTEPFFYIPFFSGYGGWVMDEQGVPTLNTQANIDGLQFIKDLRDKYKVIPPDADYNVADALFKEGKAAMIINGDWSWSSYQTAGLDIGIAPLPIIEKTGLRCAPMVSSKGFSINSNVPKEKLPIVTELLKFLMEPKNQLETAKALKTMPTRLVLYDDPFIKNDEILINSKLQIEFGRQMPVVPELRAIWDAMRPAYQAVLGGVKSAKEAAEDMQSVALRKIAEMNE